MLTLPIRDSIAATPRAYIIRLDLNGQAFSYRAGQAAYLHPKGAEKRRPYSIASAPEQTSTTGLLEFLMTDDRDAASGVSKDVIKPGALVTLEGPSVRLIPSIARAPFCSSPAAPASRPCTRWSAYAPRRARRTYHADLQRPLAELCVSGRIRRTGLGRRIDSITR
jgi:hypothetical protein